MGYVVISAKEFNLKLKCTIHSTGKMGFTEATAFHMNLSTGSYLLFAKDEDDSSIFYLIHSKKETEDGFRVIKAGQYYYVNTKALFDSLDFDYKNQNIMFDMVELKNQGEEVYKLLKRQMPRKK